MFLPLLIPLLLHPQAPSAHTHNYLLIEAVSVSSSDQNQLEPQNVSGGERIQYPLKQDKIHCVGYCSCPCFNYLTDTLEV